MKRVTLHISCQASSKTHGRSLGRQNSGNKDTTVLAVPAAPRDCTARLCVLRTCSSEKSIPSHKLGFYVLSSPGGGFFRTCLPTWVLLLEEQVPTIWIYLVKRSQPEPNYPLIALWFSKSHATCHSITSWSRQSVTTPEAISLPGRRVGHTDR